MMKKEFVNYNQALKLKALGFDEDCLARYEGKIKHIEKPLVFEFTFANLPGALNKVGYPNYPYKDVEAPTFSQAFRWFRDKHNLPSWIFESTGNWYYKIVQGDFWVEDKIKYKAYEEAESACINKLIEIVENK